MVVGTVALALAVAEVVVVAGEMFPCNNWSGSLARGDTDRGEERHNLPAGCLPACLPRECQISAARGVPTSHAGLQKQQHKQEQ